MPEESKDNINKIVMLFLAALMGITLQGMVNKNTKLENAASKDDLEITTTNLKLYVDKGDAVVLKHTDEVMEGHLRVHAESDKRIDMIIGMVSDLYEREFKKEYIIIPQTN